MSDTEVFQRPDGSWSWVCDCDPTSVFDGFASENDAWDDAETNVPLLLEGDYIG